MSSFNTLEELLHAHSANKIIPGLERISRLLERLGNPQDSLKAIHIVGTNGKGSTGAFISSVLRVSGYRTAFYSSPHLESPGERLLVNGRPISPQDWICAAQQAVSVIRKGEDMPSYFELLTASAYVLMSEYAADVGVIEAGLGGRLDATNVMRGVICSVIASISIDHTEYLGHTLEDIAAEKFAVIRHKTPTVFSGKPESLISMFREICSERKAFPFVVSENASVKNVLVSPEGNTFDFAANGFTLEGVKTGLIGRYQVENAALALSSLAVVRETLTGITDEAVRIGMLDAKWPGRLEVVSRDPVLILDGGHNYDGVRAMCQSVRELWPDENIAVVYAAMRDKDYAGCLELIIRELQPKLYVTTIPEMERAASVEELNIAASMLAEKENLHYEVATGYEFPEQALAAAKNSGSSVIIVCGSLYLVGYMKSVLKK